MAGQPKKFRNGKQLIELWTEFCDDIRNNYYIEVPTQTNFCRWLSQRFDACSRRTIYNALNKYFPTVKRDKEEINTLRASLDQNTEVLKSLKDLMQKAYED